MTRRESLKASLCGLAAVVLGAVGLGKAKAEPKIERPQSWTVVKTDHPYWCVARYETDAGKTQTVTIGSPPIATVEWSSDK